jgi:hypothetical protein
LAGILEGRIFVSAVAKVRALPIRSGVRSDLAGLVSITDLREILARLLPSWEIFKVSNAIHALRLWGPDAVFDTDRFPSPYRSRVYTGRELLSMFLDDRQYRRVVVSQSPLLKSTNYGVLVESKQTKMKFEGAPAHVDKVLRVCGELGVPSDTFIRTPTAEATMAEMVRGSVATFDSSQELEWTVEAFARYLADDRWTNRFGEEFTFDDAARSLLNKPMGSGSCLGMHVPYVAAILLQVQEQHRILGPGIDRELRLYLKRASARLQGQQNENGTWPIQWAEGVPQQAVLDPDVGDELPPSLSANHPVVWMTLLGHHLEWIAASPEELRPPLTCIKRAVTFLVTRIATLSDRSVHEFYHLLTHAGRALCHYAGIDPTRAYKLLS